jgi:hypothetical protein
MMLPMVPIVKNILLGSGIFLLLIKPDLIAGFTPVANLRSSSCRIRNTTTLRASIEINNESSIASRNNYSRRKRGDLNETGIHKIKFTGKKCVKTAPTSTLFQDNRVTLKKYFETEKFRNLLFPDNEAVLIKSPPTPRQLATWVEEAEIGGGLAPSTYLSEQAGGRNVELLVNNEHEKHDIIQIKANLQMPGLKLCSKSTIGVKLVLPDFPNYPEYQFTLLDSELEPSGPRPLVWLFNKLTRYRDKTSSFTRVSVENTKDEKMVFSTDARLEAQIRIPSGILKILPGNVDLSKFESQGSDAMQKLLEKDLGPALQSFRDSYYEYAKKISKKAVLLP